MNGKDENNMDTPCDQVYDGFDGVILRTVKEEWHKICFLMGNLAS